jgi:hypothetical protein
LVESLNGHYQRSCNSGCPNSGTIGAKGDEISGREMELWIQHVQPVWMGRKELMEKAIVDWHAALRTEGLEIADQDGMKKFIIDGYQP